jgi:hypothetical protein
MEKVDLDRYKITGILGMGADYEVRAAQDQETGQEVVLKRPVPQIISRQMHGPVEARTDRTLQFYDEVGRSIPYLPPLLGYTDRASHDAFYGDSLGQEYRVMVIARAPGIPLAGDVRARIMRVPIGLGQNLFALFPLAHPDNQTPFAVHQQLLDLEEQCFQAGYVLLDLGPQNVFYQPASNAITVIDPGDLVSPEGQPTSRSRRHRDIHDFYLEVLKFYTTPQHPPLEVNGYRDPYGLRPVISLEQELDEMAASFNKTQDSTSSAILPIIARVRDRAYADFSDFRRDLTAYLEAVRIRNRNLPDLAQARRAWSEALQLLRADYWQRYLFNPEADLTGLNNIS